MTSPQHQVPSPSWHTTLSRAGVPSWSSCKSCENQGSDNTQSYNRYSYCLNSPLMYTDPSGEFAWMVPIMLGAFMSTAVNIFSGNVHSQSDMWISAALGGASGAAGAGVGAVASSMVGTLGFWSGAISGFASGSSTGFFASTCNAWFAGATPRDGFLAGMKAGLTSGITSGIIGGISNGMAAEKIKGNYWTGKGAIIGEYTLGQTVEVTRYQLKEAYNYDNDFFTRSGDDWLLSMRMQDEFCVNSGDYNMRLTTAALNNEAIDKTFQYGMTPDKIFVNSKGDLVGGFTRYNGIGELTTVHISPYVTRSFDDVLFKAVAGHELIHAIHYSTFAAEEIGKFYFSKYTESVAYSYSRNIYTNFGYDSMIRASHQMFMNNGGYAPARFYRCLPTILW